VTREDIIRWSREVEDYADTIYEKGEYHPGWLEVRDQRFAALVAAAEREACARVCEMQENRIVQTHPARIEFEPNSMMARKCAGAIRARGSK
jgi:hypothetical protein